MPEIIFLIDTETGKCETEIKGVRGPACEKVAREIKELVGNPTVDRKTREYSAQINTKQQIKGRK